MDSRDRPTLQTLQPPISVIPRPDPLRLVFGSPHRGLAVHDFGKPLVSQQNRFVIMTITRVPHIRTAPTPAATARGAARAGHDRSDGPADAAPHRTGPLGSAAADLRDPPANPFPLEPLPAGVRMHPSRGPLFSTLRFWVLDLEPCAAEI